MLVRHAMSRRPIAVGPEALCADVMHLFRERCIRHAPVLANGTLMLNRERSLPQTVVKSRSFGDIVRGLTNKEAWAELALEDNPVGRNVSIDVVGSRQPHDVAGLACVEIIEGKAAFAVTDEFSEQEVAPVRARRFALQQTPVATEQAGCLAAGRLPAPEIRRTPAVSRL